MAETVGSIRARVRGRVQGVAFRWHTRERARALGLRGWVRNEADGSVSLVARGDAVALARLGGFLREGPPRARVDEVEIEDRELDELLPGEFEIR